MAWVLVMEEKYRLQSLFVDDNDSLEDDFQIVFTDNIDVVYGDIFQLGNHRLMCGDATVENDVLKLTDGCIMDLFITDPPYNVNYEGGTVDELTIINDNMNSVDFREFLRKTFYNADIVMRAGAVFYIWHSDTQSYNFIGACNDIGWVIREKVLWIKNQIVMGRQDYHWQHEPCLYGWKNGTHTWCSDRKQSTVLRFDKPSRNHTHPTMKPVELFLYQIKNNTIPSQNILDTFAGSGTTLIASEIHQCNSFNMELDPIYVSVIIRRWEHFTGGKAEKL